MALQFEPCPPSILEYDPEGVELRTDITGAWNHAAARLEHHILYKWFSDLDSKSSTSWCSLQSRMATFQTLDTPRSASTSHTSISTPPSLLSRPSRPRSSKSMRRLRSREPSLVLEESRPTSSEKSYDQIVHSDGGEGLFLMCKRDTVIELRGASSMDSVEALPQCGDWDIGEAPSAPATPSLNSGLLFPGRAEDEITRHSGEMGERWKGRISGLRKSGSRIFRKGD